MIGDGNNRKRGPYKKPARTIREIAMHKAWLQRKAEAKRLNVELSEALDAQAEEVWARHADPTYYGIDPLGWAYRRDCETPTRASFRREWNNQG